MEQEKFYPLIGGKHLFFYTNVESKIKLNDIDYNIYLSTKFLKDKDDPNKNCGKPDSNCQYNVVLKRETIKEVEHIKTLYNGYHHNKVEAILVNIANMVEKSTWETFYKDLNFCAKLFTQNEMIVLKNGLMSRNKETIADTIIPPRLIYRLDGFFETGLNIIKDFIDDKVFSIDITDHIFTIEKQKQIISKTFTVPDKLIVIKGLKKDDKTFDVKLNVGIDMPLRNNFSALLRSKKEIKMYLIILEENELGFRYATVIKHDDNYGVYFNPNSNLKLNGKKK